MTVRAIYEKGVFRPIKPVTLAENTEVEVCFPEDDRADSEDRANQDQVFALLRKSYASGETDVAERHNEHQP